MIRRPPRSTLSSSSAASDVYKRQVKLQPALSLSGHEGNINCVDSHPLDPKQFVSCSYDKTIKFWDLNQKQCVQTIADNLENIWAVKYSQNGKTVGSGAENGALQIYQI
eukprot:TRINITY_DN3690_c0_g1_i10.p2 TRINITY_DN3690_c0_g1~~TRINITY_DN3690_c0_g1_i10.p2  ORF type:complete len:109 (+),score=31.73 TRINITY_DN3690_c0_g1_i10:98-424(+)